MENSMQIKFTQEELRAADEEVQGIMQLVEQIGFPFPHHVLYRDLMTIVLQRYMMQAIRRFRFE